jgi:ABC-2 type transport system permease protein
LLRPVHPILTSTLVYNLAFKALTFTVLIPVWGLLYLLFRPDFSGVTAQSILLAVPAVILGFAINFLFSSAITCLAFWTTRIYSLMEFYGALRILFAGQFVPLVLMPPLIQQMAKFLPFQLYLYFPIRVALGQITPAQALVNFAWGMVWLLVAAACFWAVWRAGVKRFSAVGA